MIIRTSTRGFWLVSVIVFVGSSTALLAAKGNSGSDDYDIQASVGKLRSIGEALQRYRQTRSVRPVSERVRAEDAGLPIGITNLAHPNETWSLADGLAGFQVAKPLGYLSPGGAHFTCLYWDDNAGFGLPSMSAYFRKRGEDLPILVDLNMNSIEDMAKPNHHLKAVVLRLSGRVDLIEFDNTSRLNILEK